MTIHLNISRINRLQCDGLVVKIEVTKKKTGVSLFVTWPTYEIDESEPSSD